MKNLILTLLLLFSQITYSQITQPSAGIAMVTMAWTSLPLSRAIVLNATTQFSGYQVLKRNGANYQVTSGKTLKCYGGNFRPLSVGGTTYVTLGYGDNGLDISAAAPTNWVPILNNGGALNAGNSHIFHFLTSSSLLPTEIPFYHTFPSGKYPHVHVSSGSGVQLSILCIEE